MPRWLWVGLCVLLAALGVGGLLAARERQARWFRTELEQAKREMVAGLPNTAHARLAALSARWPGRGEVEYHLGLCEQATGPRRRRLGGVGSGGPGIAPGRAGRTSSGPGWS